MSTSFTSIFKSDYLKLLFGTIGIVYGDIGTSPLYALKSSLTPDIPVTEFNLIGIISVFIWTIFFVVTIKYIIIILDIDEQGSGGILVLASSCSKIVKKKHIAIVITLGIIGSALLFADGTITPAISVLSALEGLKIILPSFSQNYVVLCSCIVITVLFLIQKKGSGIIGHYFGLVMTVWFFVLAILGIVNILHCPQILLAFNPYYAAKFIDQYGFNIFGSVILTVTGAEAIYADLGHFGKNPIRQTWTFFVFPALILNYLGQGALLIAKPETADNPFYHLVPEFLLYPMIILATLATIIASQAIISGIFSLAWQAIMLNFLPKMHVEHTSNKHIGQVYVPVLNLVLYCLTIFSVLKFQSSENLAFAYGLSIAGVMLLTTILAIITTFQNLKLFLSKCLLILAPLLVLDIIFLLSNLTKILHGAWYAIAITFCTVIIIEIWRRNTEIMDRKKSASNQENLTEYINYHAKLSRKRINGSAVFMLSTPNQIPSSLMINLRHNKLLHKEIIFLSIIISKEPKVASNKRFTSQTLHKNIFAVTATFGFYEVPNIKNIVIWVREQKMFTDNQEEVSCFLSRSIPVISGSYRHPLTFISRKIFAFLLNNSLPYYEFLKIPYNNVIELCILYKI